eukprot:tig00021179_g19269.t1
MSDSEDSDYGSCPPANGGGALGATVRASGQADEIVRLISSLRGRKDLFRPPYPQVPSFPPGTPVRAMVAGYQALIESFEYNFTGTNYFNVRKDRGLGRVLETAREIIRDALPIKCVEGVFLGIFLTHDITDLERYPIGFKSSIDGQVYRHIVLAIKHDGKWGAMGLSRRRDLMYKEIAFKSLGDLLLDFKNSYEACFHQVKKIRVGLPIQHGVQSPNAPICWRYFSVRPAKEPWAEIDFVVSEFSRQSQRLAEAWHRTSQVLSVQEFAYKRAAPAPSPARPSRESASPVKSRGPAAPAAKPAAAPAGGRSPPPGPRRPSGSCTAPGQAGAAGAGPAGGAPRAAFLAV